MALKWAILLSHLALVVFVVFSINHWTWQLVITCLSVLSYYFSIQHYKSITTSSDDLCWTGEQWVMVDKKHRYMQLQQTSWLSSFASLLHLEDGEKKYYWLFTRNGLGDRAFRELNFLARQNLVAELNDRKDN